MLRVTDGSAKIWSVVERRDGASLDGPCAIGAPRKYAEADGPSIPSFSRWCVVRRREAPICTVVMVDAACRVAVGGSLLHDCYTVDRWPPVICRMDTVCNSAGVEGVGHVVVQVKGCF